MTTFSCSTEPDPKKRAEPSRRSSVIMRGNWAYHAYKASHDGRAKVIYLADGFVIRYGSARTRFKHFVPRGDRTFYWHPDSRRLCYWTEENLGKEVAVLDVRKIKAEDAGKAPPHEILYTPSAESIPFGLEWSPSGKALYVIEKFYDEDGGLGTRIQRVELGSKKVTQVARMGGVIDFFMPPVSRFENGDGPSNKRYWIVFGHGRGLFLVDPKGQKVRRISRLPATGLHNIEWHPKRSQFVLFFRRAAMGANGNQFKGVYLVHLDRIGREEKKGKFLEQLHNQTDIHTLWYSPQGTYITWASSDSIYFRKPGAKPEETISLVPVDDEGVELEVKGVAWHASETKIACTAGNQLLVYDLAKPEEPLVLAKFGRDTTHFTAEPVWIGDEVFLTVFQDLSQNAADKAVPKVKQAKPRR